MLTQDKDEKHSSSPKYALHGGFKLAPLSYDHDENEKRRDAVRHPVDHIDFFYSSNNTFKVGLKGQIGLNDLQTIVNINERCCFLNY